MATREEVDRLTRKLADEGKLIEAGWLAYRLLVLPADAPQVQVDETRKGFFAGAQHLFGSLLLVQDDPGSEPTDADLRRMDLISAELDDHLLALHAEANGTTPS